jgi:hypothetical protein
MYNDTGYLALQGSAEASWYLQGIQDFQDDISIGIEGGTLIGPLRVRSDLGGSFSFHHLTYGRYAAPSWELQLSPKEGWGDFEPALEYFGSYTFQADYDEDSLVQGAALGLSYDPSISQGYGLRISGAWERWPDQYVPDESGNPSGTKREDLTAAAELSAEGLLGYFADWKTTASVGLRESNTDRYLTDNGTLEKTYSEDRITAGYDSSLNWSPTRGLSLSAAVFGEGAWYSERMALDDGGQLTGTPLTVYRTGGSFSTDINLTDQLYAVVRISGLRGFSEDPAFDRWSFSLRGGLEYSF